MKRHRQRRLPLDFTKPLNPVTYERGKELFAKMREDLAKFAARSKS